MNVDLIRVFRLFAAPLDSRFADPHGQGCVGLVLEGLINSLSAAIEYLRQGFLLPGAC